MLNFVQLRNKLLVFYLGEAKHIICGVSNVGEDDSIP